MGLAMDGMAIVFRLKRGCDDCIQLKNKSIGKEF
jgi:hypothetical protein